MCEIIDFKIAKKIESILTDKSKNEFTLLDGSNPTIIRSADNTVFFSLDQSKNYFLQNHVQAEDAVSQRVRLTLNLNSSISVAIVSAVIVSM